MLKSILRTLINIAQILPHIPTCIIWKLAIISKTNGQKKSVDAFLLEENEIYKDAKEIKERQRK